MIHIYHLKKAVIMVFILIVSVVLVSVQIFGGIFSDTTSHKLCEVIDKWCGFGIIKGYDSLYRPDDYITRAEIGAILEQIIGYPEETENVYVDINDGDWYYHTMLKLAAAGVFEPVGGLLEPCRPITPEEESGILRKAFRMTGDFDFIDCSELSSFVTRGEAISHINALFGLMAIAPDVYEGGVYNHAVVRPGAVLSDMTVNGNVYITGSGGDIKLNNVTVGGTLIILGDISGLHLTNCQINAVVVNTVEGLSSIFLQQTVISNDISLESGAKITSWDSNPPDAVIVANIRPGQVVSLIGTFGQVTNNASMQAFTVAGTIRDLLIYAPLEVYGSAIVNNVYSDGSPVALFGGVTFQRFVGTPVNNVASLAAGITENAKSTSPGRQYSDGTAAESGGQNSDGSVNGEDSDNDGGLGTAPYIVNINVMHDRLLHVAVYGDIPNATPVISPGLGIVSVAGYDYESNTFVISTQQPIQSGVTYTLKLIGDSFGVISASFSMGIETAGGGVLGPVTVSTEPELPTAGIPASAVMTVISGVTSTAPVELVFTVTSSISGVRSTVITADAAGQGTPEALASALRKISLEGYDISGTGNSIVITAKNAVQEEALTLSLSGEWPDAKVWDDSKVLAVGKDSVDAEATAFVDITGTAARNAEVLVTVKSNMPNRDDAVIVNIIKDMTAAEIAFAIGSAVYTHYVATATDNRVSFAAKEPINGERIEYITISEQNGGRQELGIDINVNPGGTGQAGTAAKPASASVEVSGASAYGTVNVIIDSNINGRVCGEALVNIGDGGQAAASIAAAVVPGYILDVDGAVVTATAVSYAEGETLTITIENAATGVTGRVGSSEPGQASMGSPGSDTWVITGVAAYNGGLEVSYSFTDNGSPVQSTVIIPVSQGQSAALTSISIRDALNAAFAELGLETELTAESDGDTVTFMASAELCPICLDIRDFIGEIDYCEKDREIGVMTENGVTWTVADGEFAAGEIKFTIYDSVNVLAEWVGSITSPTKSGVYEAVLSMEPEGFTLEAIMEGDEIAGVYILPDTAAKALSVKLTYNTGITSDDMAVVTASQTMATISVPNAGIGTGSLRVTAVAGDAAESVVLEFSGSETGPVDAVALCGRICDALDTFTKANGCSISYDENGVITLISNAGQTVALSIEKADVHMDITSVNTFSMPDYIKSELAYLIGLSCPDGVCQNIIAHGSGGLGYEIGIITENDRKSVSGEVFINTTSDGKAFNDFVNELAEIIQAAVLYEGIVGVGVRVLDNHDNGTVIYLDLDNSQYTPDNVFFNLYPLSLNVAVETSSKRTWVWPEPLCYKGGLVTVYVIANGASYQVNAIADSGLPLLEAVGDAVSGLRLAGVYATVINGELIISCDPAVCDVTAFSINEAVINGTTASTGTTETAAWSAFELTPVSGGYIHMTVRGAANRPPEVYGFFIETESVGAADKLAALFGGGSAYTAESNDDGEVLKITAKTAVHGEAVTVTFTTEPTGSSAALQESVAGTLPTARKSWAEWIIENGAEKPGTLTLNITDNINGNVYAEIIVNPEEHKGFDALAALLAGTDIQGYSFSTGKNTSGDAYIRVTAASAVEGQILGLSVTEVPAGVLTDNVVNTGGVPGTPEVRASSSIEFTNKAVSDGWLDIILSDGITEATRSVAVDKGMSGAELAARVAAAFNGAYMAAADDNVVIFTAPDAVAGGILTVVASARLIELGFDAVFSSGDPGNEVAFQLAASALTFKGSAAVTGRITLTVQSNKGAGTSVSADVPAGATGYETAKALAAAANNPNYTFTAVNETVTVTANRVTDGEILTLSAVNNSIPSGAAVIIGSQVPGVAGSEGKAGVWTVEIKEPLTAGDVLEVDENRYPWNDRLGNGPVTQAASLADIISRDTTELTVTSQGPFLIFTQKQPGAGGKPAVRLTNN